MNKKYRDFRQLSVLWSALLCLFFPLGDGYAGPPSQRAFGSEQTPDFAEMTLEELMDIEITSVSKRPQRLSGAAAAVFVITQEDIRRSGATTIPEALRMVPGLQVAKIDAKTWAVTSRGFNGRLANKLLVLMDGRTVYTPTFSGVHWDMQDTMLEDVDRIEVIRGPGATLWGANAVNGVINIMTKEAKDTQGGLVSVGAGTEERGFGGLRYGGKLGDDAYYRIYAKYFERDGGVDSSGHDTADDWDAGRAGFRVDWQGDGPDAFTFQGDVSEENCSKTATTLMLTPPFASTAHKDYEVTAANLLSRWTRTQSDTSDMALQLYYDYIDRETTRVHIPRRTVEVDFQHRFGLTRGQEIVWGLGYRFTSDDSDATFSATMSPESRDDHLFSAFFQDEMALIEDRLYLTLGSKLEHNDYTGFEVQPNVRVLWTPKQGHSVWAAVSRAVRTPSRSEEDARLNSKVLPPDALFPGSPVAVSSFFGSRDFKSEVLMAYEIGYRTFPTKRLSLDIAAFFNDYDNLRSGKQGEMFAEATPSPEHLVIPVTADNRMEAQTYGVEVAAQLELLPWWRLRGAYTYLEIEQEIDDNTAVLLEDPEGQSPRHQFSLRSSMELLRDLDLDLWLRYVDDLPGQDVDSYTTLDARLAWRPRKDLEVSLVGQNLLDKHHPEFTMEIVESLPIEAERSVYGKITWQF
ncbi:MAG: TonB-dependent receptor [Thermodesulfobacteriota bacterium]|nr:TonB-dependent receptor [Thermodesulfobacteriota bacterium]